MFSDHKITFVSSPNAWGQRRSRHRAGFHWVSKGSNPTEVTALLFPVLEDLATQSLEKALRALELNQEKVKHISGSNRS